MKARHILLIYAAALAACDPAHIVRMEVVGNSADATAVPTAMASVAQRFELDPSEGIKGPPAKGSISYARIYEGNGTKHPRSIGLFVEPTEKPNTWHVEIFEWLTFGQTQISKDIEHAVEDTAKTEGFTVKHE